jgi:hypothetical protein
MTQRVTDRLGRVVLAFAWFDLGLLILLLPWSHFWEGNSLLARYPDLIPYVLSGYLRGAISGIGLFDMLVAAEALIGRRQTAVATRQ